MQPRLWYSFLCTAPLDLSADLSVVLISCDSVLSAPIDGALSSVCDNDVGQQGSECSLRLWYSLLCSIPRDLSADLSVVLISRDSVLNTTVRGRLSSVCVEVLYVVRQGSECGLGCGTHFSARLRRL